MAIVEEGITSVVFALRLEETCNNRGNPWETRTGVFETLECSFCTKETPSKYSVELL